MITIDSQNTTSICCVLTINCNPNYATDNTKSHSVIS